MKHNEGSAVARGESGDGFENTILSAGSFTEELFVSCHGSIKCKIRNLRGIPSKEMIAGLLRRELTNRREHSEGIAGQHNDIRWLTVGHARNLGVGNVLNRVRTPGVFCNADIIVVGDPGERVVDNIFENTTKLDRVVDFWFFLSREVDAFGIATSFNIEDAGV